MQLKERSHIRRDWALWLVLLFSEREQIILKMALIIIPPTLSKSRCLRTSATIQNLLIIKPLIPRTPDRRSGGVGGTMIKALKITYCFR